MKRRTQREKVLEHLRYTGPLTQDGGKALFGIGHLASRIDELKKDGHHIQVEMIRVMNRDGTTSRVARYIYVPPAINLPATQLALMEES